MSRSPASAARLTIRPQRSCLPYRRAMSLPEGGEPSSARCPAPLGGAYSCTSPATRCDGRGTNGKAWLGSARHGCSRRTGRALTAAGTNWLPRPADLAHQQLVRSNQRGRRPAAITRPVTVGSATATFAARLAALPPPKQPAAGIRPGPRRESPSAASSTPRRSSRPSTMASAPRPATRAARPVG